MALTKSSIGFREVFFLLFSSLMWAFAHALNRVSHYAFGWDELTYMFATLVVGFHVFATLYFEARYKLPEPTVEAMTYHDPWAIDFSKIPSYPFTPKPKPTPVPVYAPVASPVKPIAPAPSGAGYVYLMRIETGLYKIGLSKKPENRKQGISSAIPYEIELVHTIKCQNMGKIEQFFLETFESKRVKGEWFALDPEDVEYFKIFTEA